MTIGIILISTGNYHTFIRPLLTSIEKFFLTNRNKKIFLFTDSSEKYDAVSIPVQHLPFPYPTLFRYKYISEYKDVLSSTDYLFYLDVDSLVVDYVGEEILGEIVAVHHPYFQPNKEAGRYPFERRAESLAYVEKGIGYYCGGFQGGKSNRYLQASKILNYNITDDLERNLIAEWHDESHWNKYLADNPPTTILDASYMVPQESQKEPMFKQLKPKILALQKNHAQIR